MKFIKRLSIGSRLQVGFVLILIIFVIGALLGVQQTRSLADQTDNIYSHPLAVSNAVLRINMNIVKMHRSMKDVALAEDNASVEKAVSIVNALEKKVFSDFDLINDRFLGDPKQYEQARNIFTEWKPIRNQVIELMLDNRTREAADITKGIGAVHVAEIEKAMDDLGTFAQKKAAEFLSAAKRHRESAFQITYILVSVIFIIYIALAQYLMQVINFYKSNFET